MKRFFLLSLLIAGITALSPPRPLNSHPLSFRLHAKPELATEEVILNENNGKSNPFACFLPPAIGTAAFVTGDLFSNVFHGIFGSLGKEQLAAIQPILNGPVSLSLSILFGSLVAMTIQSLYQNQIAMHTNLIGTVEEVRALESLSQGFPEPFQSKTQNILNDYLQESLQDFELGMVTSKSQEMSQLLVILNELSEKANSPLTIVEEAYRSVSKLRDLRAELISTLQTGFSGSHYANMSFLGVALLFVFQLQSNGGFPLSACWGLLVAAYTMAGLVINDLTTPFSGIFQTISITEPVSDYNVLTEDTKPAVASPSRSSSAAVSELSGPVSASKTRDVAVPAPQVSETVPASRPAPSQKAPAVTAPETTPPSSPGVFESIFQAGADLLGGTFEKTMEGVREYNAKKEAEEKQSRDALEIEQSPASTDVVGMTEPASANHRKSPSAPSMNVTDSRVEPETAKKVPSKEKPKAEPIKDVSSSAAAPESPKTNGTEASESAKSAPASTTISGPVAAAVSSANTTTSGESVSADKLSATKGETVNKSSSKEEPKTAPTIMEDVDNWSAYTTAPKVRDTEAPAPAPRVLTPPAPSDSVTGDANVSKGATPSDSKPAAGVETVSAKDDNLLSTGGEPEMKMPPKEESKMETKDTSDLENSSASTTVPKEPVPARLFTPPAPSTPVADMKTSTPAEKRMPETGAATASPSANSVTLSGSSTNTSTGRATVPSELDKLSALGGGTTRQTPPLETIKTPTPRTKNDFESLNTRSTSSESTTDTDTFKSGDTAAPAYAASAPVTSLGPPAAAPSVFSSAGGANFSGRSNIVEGIVSEEVMMTPRSEIPRAATGGARDIGNTNASTTDKLKDTQAPAPAASAPATSSANPAVSSANSFAPEPTANASVSPADSKPATDMNVPKVTDSKDGKGSAVPPEPSAAEFDPSLFTEPVLINMPTMGKGTGEFVRFGLRLCAITMLHNLSHCSHNDFSRLSQGCQMVQAKGRSCRIVRHAV